MKMKISIYQIRDEAGSFLYNTNIGNSKKEG